MKKDFEVGLPSKRSTAHFPRILASPRGNAVILPNMYITQIYPRKCFNYYCVIIHIICQANILDEFNSNPPLCAQIWCGGAGSRRWNSQVFNILLFIFWSLSRESVIIALRSPRLHCLCKWFCLWLTAHSNRESGRIITACLPHRCYLGEGVNAARIGGSIRMDLFKCPQIELLDTSSHLPFKANEGGARPGPLSHFWLIVATFTPHQYCCWIRGPQDIILRCV